MARTTLYAFDPDDDKDGDLSALLDNDADGGGDRIDAAGLPLAAQDPTYRREAEGAEPSAALVKVSDFKAPSLHDDDTELLAPLLDDRSMAPTARIDAGAEKAMQGPANDGDPEIEAERRKAELSALKASNLDRDYGWTEALRDNGAGALASVLDIAFNKGRGLGGIVGATANEVGRQQDTRDKRALEAGKLAVALRGKQTDPILVELQRQRIENAANAEKGRQDRFTQSLEVRGDINSPINQAKIKLAGLMAAESAGGRLGAEHELNAQTAGDQANISGAQEAARLGQQVQFAPQLNGAAADRAAAEQGARIQTDLSYAPQTTAAAVDKANALIAPELAKQQGLNPILADRTNGGVGTGLSAEGIARANPNLSVSDPQLLQQALKTRAVNAKTLEDIKAANRGAEIVQRLNDTAQEYQDMIRNDPSSIGSGKAAELRRQYTAHGEEYAGVLARISGNQSLTAHKEALSLLPDIHNPYAVAGIRGLWSPIEANINGNLGAIGISARAPAFMGGKNQPQPAAAAPAADPSAPGAGAPGYSHDLSETGLGGKQPAPKPKVSPTPGKAIHHIRKSDGSVVPTQIPLERLKNLPDGWAVVD